MPTYQYRCTENHESEIVQSFTDEPLRECPICGAPVRKIYGSIGVVFKGSGFYRNDSRNSKSTSVTGKSTDSAGSSDSGTAASKKESASSGSDSGSSATPAASSSPAASTSTSTSSSSGSAA